MALKATEVFVPGSFPTHTYVARRAEQLEQTLRDALDTPGQLVSLSGPSKSGKTVLVEKVVGRDYLIPVSGAGIQSAGEIWDRVLDWMDLPASRTKTRTTDVGAKLSGEGTVGGGIPMVLKGEATLSTEGAITKGAGNSEVRERRGLTQVVDEIGGSEFVVLVDDFHYMPRVVQSEAAKVLKEAVRLGVKVCTASVSHRGDDVVRANPELRGRVRAVDLSYWPAPDLTAIAEAGFLALGADLPADAIEAFVKESAGSPQLMQLICLHACFVLRLREAALLRHSITITEEARSDIFVQVSASTDFRSLVDVLDAGPKTRGAERKTYRFHDDSEGDVYRCALKAIAADPPRLSFPYEELTRRTNAVCRGGSPVGSSVTGTCSHMAKLALEKFPNERVIDWDEQKQVLDLPDPYLLFYLRWSGRLTEVEH